MKKRRRCSAQRLKALRVRTRLRSTPRAPTEMDADAWARFQVPDLPFTSPEEAATFLGIPPGDKDDVEKVKAAYRKMCLKCHPDKNKGHEEIATKAFTAVTAALHTITTVNFDFDRWRRNFSIPPMQSLEDVLMLALRGADPDQIEAMLRKRGDYRPHPKFGIDLAVPWTAGSKEAPSWDVQDASEFNTTEQIGLRGATNALVVQGDTAESLLARLGEDRALGASAERPWERVGGSGFEESASRGQTGADLPALRPDLVPGDPEAPAQAERFNDDAVEAFKVGKYDRALALSKEAARLVPASAVFHSNAAAAALKLRKHAEAAQLAKRAYQLDGSNARAFLRAAQANLAIESEESVKAAIEQFEKVLQLEPDNKAAARGRKDALLTWEAEFED